MILRDDTLADDALQESFLKIMRHEAELGDVKHPLRWLYRIVDRCCFDHLRKQRQLAPREETTDPIGPHPGIQLEVRDAIVALLGELDDDEKRIAMLAFVDGLSQGEIAEEVGCSRVTINKKIQTIRARADRVLEQPSPRMRGVP